MFEKIMAEISKSDKSYTPKTKAGATTKTVCTSQTTIKELVDKVAHSAPWNRVILYIGCWWFKYTRLLLGKQQW